MATLLALRAQVSAAPLKRLGGGAELRGDAALRAQVSAAPLKQDFAQSGALFLGGPSALK